MSHVDDGELTAYADGAYPVAGEEAQRIAAHLTACADCRTRLAQNEELRSRAAAILVYATPLSTSAPAFETLQQQVKPRRVRSTLPLQWAASIVLAVGMGWLGRGMWQYQTPTREVPAMTAQAPATEAAQPLTTDAAPAAVVAPQLAERRGAKTGRSETVREPASAATEEDMMVAADALESSPPPVAPTGAPTVAAAAPAPSLMARASAAHPTIAGLAVKSVTVVGDTTVVEQVLADGNVIRLSITEPRAEMAEAQAAKAVTGNAAARQREAMGATTGSAAAPAHDVVVRLGTRIVRVRGDVTQDSLRALAEKIR